MKKRAALHNLGCKVNAYELEAMQQLLEHAGYEIVPFAPGADVYVINTCSVTNIADRKSRQMLHKAKKMNPDAIVVATGCYVQTDTDHIEKDPAVDLILGNNRKGNLIELLNQFENEKQNRISMVDINHTKEYEKLSIERTAEHVRAFIKVQDGCNQFCTYCIIPYARGRVRSRDLADVLQEIQTLSENGYQEVVLTGIHLSSYGIDFQNDNTLLSLIQAVAQVDGIKRIRLGSLEPRIVTDEFAEQLSKIDKICPHFHLSMQSGCDETLKRMNRRYDSAEYMEKCKILRKYFPDAALTTDIIVGFPGETEEEFQKSYEFTRDVQFYETHIFKYSIRKGTRAAAMDNQVSDQIKSNRSDIMLELHEQNSSAYEEKWIGKNAEILLEERVELDGNEYLSGCTREYVKVVIPYSDKYHVNDLISVHLDKIIKQHILLATPMEYGDCNGR